MPRSRPLEIAPARDVGGATTAPAHGGANRFTRSGEPDHLQLVDIGPHRLGDQTQHHVALPAYS